MPARFYIGIFSGEKIALAVKIANILASSPDGEDRGRVKSMAVGKVKDAGQILKEILAADTAPNFLLIICPDRIRRERILGSILKKFCTSYDENTKQSETLTSVNAENLNLGTIQSLIDNINSLSLFSSRKFIAITNTDELTATLNKKILDILQAGNPDTHMIFTAAKLAANSVIYNYFKKSSALIELPELKNLELNRWVQKELRNAGINFSDDALPESIIQSGEHDPDKIHELIERLALYLDGETAGLDDLSSLSKQAPDASEFSLIDILPNKNLTWKAELLLEQILAAGKNSFALLGLIARTYTNYLQIAYLRDKGMNAQQIRQKLNISPWIFNKQIEASKHYSLDRLQNCLKNILLADSKLKNRSLGDQAIFSELIHNL